MQINHFRGDFTEISSKTEALVICAGEVSGRARWSSASGGPLPGIQPNQSAKRQADILDIHMYVRITEAVLAEISV